MDIPLTNPKEQDIFSLGFDPSLSRAIPDEATGVVYDSINDTQNTASLLSGGNLNLKTLTIGGLVRQVAPGDDIQAAIDAMNREGGGTVQFLAKTYLLRSSLQLRSNVTLAGAGRDVTILDFERRIYGIYSTGTQASGYEKNMAIRDLTVKNSTAAGAIFLTLCSSFSLENISVTGSTNGIQILGCNNFRVSNSESKLNTNHGVFIYGSTFTSSAFTLTNVLAQNNFGAGFQIGNPADSSGIAINFSLLNCQASGNLLDGFNVTGNTNLNSMAVSCISDANGGDGYDIAIGYISLVGSVGTNNSGGGFNISGVSAFGVRLVGCFSSANTGADFTDASSLGVVIGCVFETIGSVPTVSLGENSSSYANSEQTLGQQLKYFLAQNKSGGNVPQGAVVVFNPTASTTDQFSTTTVNGNNKVMGMVSTLLNSNPNNGYTHVLTEGFTQNLLAVNGTSSLSVGDFLSTYSHAYYAKKAIAGDTVFAICLEAPTTGTALVDALLIPPRLI